ncbi:MAG: DNA-binding protein [Lachnospiraceae bacterium]|nr:DNA-binding protein [Lachnospiraceae bacterium]
MPGYITTKEASERWGISIRYVNVLCHNGKIPLAQKLGTIWAIPEDTEKPTQDRRIKSGEYKNWRKRHNNKRGELA